jgi:activating signal cointegrator complex subunit 2
MWILDGRVYHYPKPGAKEVASEADAQAVIQQAAQAAKEIHGLGPGGNKPGIMRPSSTTTTTRGSGASSGAAQGPTQGQQDGGEVKAPTERQEQQSSGSGRGGGRSGGGGGGRGGNHKYKDKNKAAIGNHHRKDRAAQKMSRAAGI